MTYSITVKKTLNPHLLLLTGPKYVGKTGVGLALASLCGVDFTDLDELVEKQTGKNPRSLYKESPERFRKAETEALEALMKTFSGTVSPCCIVAAGGGIIDNENALTLLKTPEVFIIYLDVSAETAWNRICAEKEAGGTLPPFLDTADPQETHKNLHCRRASAYRRIAHITIQGEDKDPDQIGREIARQVPFLKSGLI
jgi:shikimate kinase